MISDIFRIRRRKFRAILEILNGRLREKGLDQRWYYPRLYNIL